MDLSPAAAVDEDQVIAMAWSHSQDLALPIQEGAITGIAIEWEDCTLAHQATSGKAILLPNMWEPYLEEKPTNGGGIAKNGTDPYRHPPGVLQSMSYTRSTYARCGAAKILRRI